MSLSQRLPTHAFECSMCCSSRLTDLKRMRNLRAVRAESIWDHTRREDAKAEAHVLCMLSIAACLINAAVGACSGEPEYSQCSLTVGYTLGSGAQIRWSGQVKMRCDANRCGRLPLGMSTQICLGEAVRVACGRWHVAGGMW